VNNSVGFPGIFRGVLDVRARKITDAMCIAAAHEMAKVAEDLGMNEDYILPRMDNTEVFWREAVAIGIKAQDEGLALLKVSREQLTENAKSIITRSREMTHTSTVAGLIRNPDPEIRLAVAGE
jgi:malate dehydrogenase (oxaloacetate-decarboxylating)